MDNSHILFTDIDGDVHVAPRANIKMDSFKDDEDGKLIVSVFYPTDYDEYSVSREEFSRLTDILAGVHHG